MDRLLLGAFWVVALLLAHVAAGSPGSAGAGRGDAEVSVGAPGPVVQSSGGAAAPGSVAAAVPASGGTGYEYYRYRIGEGWHLLLAEIRGSRIAVADTGSYGCFSGSATGPRTWRGFDMSRDGFYSGSLTAAATIRRGTRGKVLTWSSGSGDVRARRTSTAEATRILQEWYWEGTPRQVARRCRGPRVVARVKAVEGTSPMHVSVSPASSAFNWRLTVQRRTAAGSWRVQTTGTTRTTSDEVLGVRSTRTFALPPGTYRVRVHGVRGYPGSTSRPVTLRR